MSPNVQQALKLYEQGRKKAAVEFLIELIKQDPTLFDCIACLAKIYYKEQHFDLAQQQYEIIHKAMPWDIEATYALGNIWKKKDATIALSYLQKAKTLAKKDSHQETILLYDIAKLLLKLEKVEHSLSLVEQLLIKDADHLGGLNLKAQILATKDKPEAAIAIYEKLLLKDPNQPQLLNNLGEILKLNPDTLARAAQLFLKATKVHPNWLPPHTAYASCLMHQGKMSEAITYHKHLFRQYPNDISALLGLVQCYSKMGDHRASISFAEKILQLDPNHTVALNHMARSSMQLGSPEAGINYLEKSLKIKKEATTLNMIGGAYNYKKEYQKSLNAYRESLVVEPDQNTPHYQILKCLSSLFEWEEMIEGTAQLGQRIDQHITQKKYHEELPLLDFSNYNIPISLHYKMAVFACQQIEQNQLNKSSGIITHQARQRSNDTIRIAYISPDFKNHPVGRLISPLFACHDREHYEIYCYSLTTADDTDIYRNRVIEGSDLFRDLSQYSTEKAVSQIREDKIDIIIDLAGHTKDAAPQILRQHPAPICCQLLGYPGTMGSSWHDYLLADKWLVPESVFEFYSEKIVHLNNAFVGPYVRPSTKLPERKDIGLPDYKFVFVAFNKVQKIEVTIFDAWMQMLHKTPNSILLLSQHNPVVRKNILLRAVDQGIEEDRIFFSSHHSHQQYIDCHSLYDLFLDTWHYSAGSTLVACLSAGLPALTIIDQTNASRMGASIIAASGLTDMITSSIDEYINKAVDLYNDPQSLKSMRDHLSNPSLPLFDYDLFARQLEAAFVRVIDRYDNQLAPDHIVT